MRNESGIVCTVLEGEADEGLRTACRTTHFEDDAGSVVDYCEAMLSYMDDNSRQK